MKKLASALLALSIAASGAVLPLSASAADAAWQSDTEMMSLLSALDIMVGDDDGNYYLDSSVTRAEMAKIAVASSSYKDTVAKGMSFSPFSDVKSSFWGAPYIQAAVSAGIVEGYIDGTFRPDGSVTYEEALTMMLKVLGYTNSDFGASYPYGQVGRAEGLEMTAGMDAEIGDTLTRRQVARLVCNSLDTSLKDSNSDLISIHDCQIVEDVTIIADSSEDSTLASNEIATSNGKYKLGSVAFDSDYVGLRGDMVVKDSKYYIAFSPDGDIESNKYIVYSTLDDTILAYEEGDNTNIRELKLSSTTTCYKNSTSYSYSSLKSEMEMGDIIRVSYNDNNEIDYINYSEGSLVGPVKVTSSDWLGNFETNSSTKIMRDGSAVSSSAIKTNDIVYFCDDLNMVFAYSKKITGIYESASPSKDAPQSVTVSSVSYEIEGSEAFNDLSSSGSINYGDTVTLLMGKDGNKVAGVVTSTAASTTSVAGYVTGTGKKSFSNSDGTTYTSNYVDIIAADGTAYTYPVTTSSASSYMGKAVRATIKNGKATVAVCSDNSKLSGYVSYEKMTIGGMAVSKDVKILDTVNNSSYPIYAKVYMQRIDGLTLSASSIRYYSTNSDGEISELILLNVTGDAYAYGIVTSNTVSKGGTTKIDIDSTSYECSKSVTSGCGVQVHLSGSTVYTATNLAAYSGTVTDIDTVSVTVGSIDYLLSDKVKVYKRIDAGNYQTMSLNDAISDMENYSFTCYYDKKESNGGRVRVIVCTAK